MTPCLAPRARWTSLEATSRALPSELVQGLYRAARTFAGGGPQIDDITSIICKVG